MFQKLKGVFEKIWHPSKEGYNIVETMMAIFVSLFIAFLAFIWAMGWLGIIGIPILYFFWPHTADVVEVMKLWGWTLGISLIFTLMFKLEA